MSIETNHGATNRQFRLLENLIIEIQTCVHILRDKKEIVKAHSQLISIPFFLPPHQTIPPIQTSPSIGAQCLHSSTPIIPNAPSFQHPLQKSMTILH